MNAFSHMSWGWLGWGLNWLAQAIFFHQSNYFTQSTAVADWGLPHGGPRAYLGGGAGGGFYRSSNGYGRGALDTAGRVRTGAPIVRVPAYGGNRAGQGYGFGYQGREYQAREYQGQSYSRPFQLAYSHSPQIGSRPQQGYPRIRNRVMDGRVYTAGRALDMVARCRHIARQPPAIVAATRIREAQTRS